MLLASVILLLTGCADSTSSAVEGSPGTGSSYLTPVTDTETADLSLDWYGDITGTVTSTSRGMLDMDVDFGDARVVERPFLDLNAALSEFPDAKYCTVSYWPLNMTYIWVSDTETFTMHVPPLGDGMGEFIVVGVANGVDVALIESVASGRQETPAFIPVQQ